MRVGRGREEEGAVRGEARIGNMQMTKKCLAQQQPLKFPVVAQYSRTPPLVPSESETDIRERECEWR